MAISASPVAILPRFIAIKGDNGNYLSLTSNGLLSFNAPSKTRLATHEVLYNEDESTFVIRSANKRFWRRDSHGWIFANWEGQPPSASDMNARFKLVKLSSGKLALQSAMRDNLYLKRYVNDHDGYKAVMTALDVSSEVEVSDASDYALSLPQYIYLKGFNGYYVHIYYEGERKWLKYHGEDPGNLWGMSEVHFLIDGSVALYSPESTGFWRNSTNWIWADASRTEFVTNRRCHFEPVKLSKSLIAFRSNFNNSFCKRLTDYFTDSMNAAASNTNDVETRHTLTEAVAKINVVNVKYLLNLVSISDQRVRAVAHGSVRNNSPFTTSIVVTAVISQTVSRTRSWSNSFTFNQSVTTSFKAGFPFLAKGSVEVEIGFEQSFSNEWGETTEENIQFQTEYRVEEVPPGGLATVTVICSTANMRLPFTYTSRDIAPDGVDRPPMDFIDGIYEGVDAYKFEAEITGSLGKATEKIPLKLADASKMSYVVPDASTLSKDSS